MKAMTRAAAGDKGATKTAPKTATKTAPTKTAPDVAPTGPSDSLTADGWVRIATVGRPHGVRGEVRVWLDNPSSTLLFDGPPLRVRKQDKAAEPIQIASMRDAADALIVQFRGVSDRDAAAKLTHAALEVPRTALPALDDGEFYHIDVIGAEVFDADSGERLGVVAGITETSVDVLAIQTADGEVLVPIVGDYVVSIGETPGKVLVRNLDHWR